MKWLSAKCILKVPRMGSMIANEKKYSLPCSEVWGDVLRSPQGTITGSSEDKGFKRAMNTHTHTHTKELKMTEAPKSLAQDQIVLSNKVSSVIPIDIFKNPGMGKHRNAISGKRYAA